RATIRKIVLATGEVSTIAGSGEFGSVDGVGGLARLNATALWGDGANLYFVEQSYNTVRKLALASRAVTTIAGSPVSGFTDGIGSKARFSNPRALWGDGVNLYVSDDFNGAIRKVVIATGEVTTLPTGRLGRLYEGIWGDGANLYVAHGDLTIKK